MPFTKEEALICTKADIPAECPTCGKPRKIVEFRQPEKIYDVYFCDNNACPKLNIPADIIEEREYP